MIGHELGGRYQVIERIGGGGMALVYRAHDILLNRNVAIKVLRSQFVHDEEFIRRFRREAQSAASLSHPNVVSIYDVGQEDEVHYIVMEYIEGKNLNEIIKERAPLQVDEAVRIAGQICDALDHAHQNQIIHRDIKPHNILIGRTGRVKVTDFGIARAVTSTTITQTGSVVGSVHYFSPEHAKGVAAGEKSDLYSLGIVLYQMLTGSLPFLGESPISVALKHLQEEFEEPRKLNHMIPQSVENVILKSMRKNPDERYQSAKEMLYDLETCLLPERRSESKVFFDDDDDEDRTRIVPAIKHVPQGMGPRSTPDDRMRREEEEEYVPQTKRKWVKPTIIIGSTLLVLLGMYLLIQFFNNKFQVQDVVMPSVINETLETATSMLEEQGLVVEQPEFIYNPNFEENIVYKQSKDEGMTVKAGSSVLLTVSTAKPLEVMEDYSTMAFDEAVRALTALGVPQDRITQDPTFSADFPAGQVISQQPAAGTEFDPANDAVVLVVSKGAEEVKMPDLSNLTEAEAKSRLEENRLVLETVDEESSYNVEKGRVTKQWPFDPGSMVAPESKVTIFISTGYPQEALRYTFKVPVAPDQTGGRTNIRIEYSDARNNGEKQDWGTRTVGKPQMLDVDMVLAPNNDGVVLVYRDGQLSDTYTINYMDARNGTVPQPELPEPEPTPTPTPTPEPTPPPETQSPEATNPDDTVETGGEGDQGEGDGNGSDSQN